MPGWFWPAAVLMPLFAAGFWLVAHLARPISRRHRTHQRRREAKRHGV